MRQSCHGLIINLALIFLIYCSIQANSAETEISNVSPNITLENSSETTTANNSAPTEILSDELEISDSERSYCMRPAIEQYARPLIPQLWRRNGGLIVQFLIVLFTFLGLTVVCDGYFVSSVHRISEELKLSPDVAGATFLAVGTSIYKLPSAIIGVFVTSEDYDVSGAIVGSTVYNILFVISVYTLYSGTVCFLNWRPLVRECIFCSISIVATFVVTIDDYITWYEALTMVLVYVMYCASLYISSSRNKQRTQSLNSQQINQTSIDSSQPKGANEETGKPSLDTNLQETVNPMRRPVDAGFLARIFWAIGCPIHFMCEWTIPDCRTQKYRNWYALTFFISIIWVSFYSGLMVWQITIIGSTIGIPDAVMGLTFVAAGLFVPKVLSSIAILKKGYGDMVVSSAVGSTIFDVLICLGLPWLIQTIVLGGHINVFSKGQIYSTLLQLSVVVLLLLLAGFNGWKLDRRLGSKLLILLLLFITILFMEEYGVFGSARPRECATDY